MAKGLSFGSGAFESDNSSLFQKVLAFFGTSRVVSECIDFSSDKRWLELESVDFFRKTSACFGKRRGFFPENIGLFRKVLTVFSDNHGCFARQKRKALALRHSPIVLFDNPF